MENEFWSLVCGDGTGFDQQIDQGSWFKMQVLDGVRRQLDNGRRKPIRESGGDQSAVTYLLQALQASREAVSR